MNNIVKIIIAVLATGAVAVFVVFWVLPGERPEEIPESMPLMDTPPEITPPSIVLEEATTTEEVSEKEPPLPKEAVKNPVLPPTKIPTVAPIPTTTKNQSSSEEKIAELPACEHKEYTVRIFSAHRAEPSSLNIYIGDTITFVNEDNDLRWPGADPHPTHSSLPLFDALGGISKGQSYSHTFKVEGVYNWHDHLLDDPPSLGTITVLPCAK